MSQEKSPSRILSESVSLLDLNARYRVKIPLVCPITGVPPAAVAYNDFRLLVLKPGPGRRGVPLLVAFSQPVAGCIETIDTDFMKWFSEQVLTHTAHHVVKTVTTLSTNLTVTFTKNFINQVVLV